MVRSKLWLCPRCRASTEVDVSSRHRPFRRGLAVWRTRRCQRCGFEGVTAEFWLDDMPRAAAELVPPGTAPTLRRAPQPERLPVSAMGLTIAEAADRTRRHPELLRRWCREGRISAVRTRAGWRIAEAHLELAATRRPSPAGPLEVPLH